VDRQKEKLTRFAAPQTGKFTIPRTPWPCVDTWPERCSQWRH